MFSLREAQMQKPQFDHVSLNQNHKLYFLEVLCHASHISYVYTTCKYILFAPKQDVFLMAHE